MSDIAENKYQKAFRLLLDDYYQTPKHWEDYQTIKEAIDAVGWGQDGQGGNETC